MVGRQQSPPLQRFFMSLLLIAALSSSLTTTFGFQTASRTSLNLKLQQKSTLEFSKTDPPTLTRRSTSSASTLGRRRSTSSSTQLHAAANPLVALASSPVGAIVVLAGIVLVHESGHYLAARAFNIRVEEFSVGFGPKLVGFEAFGNSFNLRALPLGGYVKFPENYNMTLVQEQQKAAQNAFAQRKEKEEWTPWQEVLNIVTLGEWDERRRRQAKKKQEEEQAAASIQQSKWWQSLLGRNSTANKAAVADPEDFDIEYYDDETLLQNRPWTERAVVLSAGVIFNLILSFSIYFGAIGPVGNGLPQPVFDSGVVVTAAPTKDGPAVGLLQKGDIITAVNGNPLQISRGTSIPAAQKQVSDVISSIRQTPDGGAIEFQVQRGGETDRSTTGDVPAKANRATQTIAIKPTRTGSSKEEAKSTSPQSIGVLLSPNMKTVEKLQSNNPVIAAKLAWQYLADICTQTLNGILSVLSTFIMGSGPPPGQSISGPIGLIKQGSNVVSTKDWTAVFLFTAALSVNLAVINALPLPALDGGQLVFVIAEAITGRKVDQRLQEGITSVAVLFFALGQRISSYWGRQQYCSGYFMIKAQHGEIMIRKNPASIT